ncbi:uncharacterized protein I206_102498 [Kwoniella pini CBS 10737]|uniref:Protein kinase domain-containing protein n=1 Tax=Kwoniella pini CBS 10737 TaxID=1296096 RepID=A0AAJ8MP00_9TREE
MTSAPFGLMTNVETPYPSSPPSQSPHVPTQAEFDLVQRLAQVKIGPSSYYSIPFPSGRQPHSQLDIPHVLASEEANRAESGLPNAQLSEPSPSTTTYTSLLAMSEQSRDLTESTISTQFHQPAKSTPESSQDITLNITAYIDTGYIWDFWLAEHPIFGMVVLKVVNRSDYPCQIPRLDPFVHPKNLINEALKEEKFYVTHLKHLQGSVVPKYYGLYTSGNTDSYLAIILEYAGVAIGQGYTEIGREWTEKIYEAYKQLHLQGVTQFDIDVRHILIDNADNIRLEGSCIRGRFGGRRDMNLLQSQLPSEYWSGLKDPEAYISGVRQYEAMIGWAPPHIRAHNEKRGVVYDENGFEVKRNGIPEKRRNM